MLAVEQGAGRTSATQKYVLRLDCRANSLSSLGRTSITLSLTLTLALTLSLSHTLTRVGLSFGTTPSLAWQRLSGSLKVWVVALTRFILVLVPEEVGSRAAVQPRARHSDPERSLPSPTTLT